MGHTQDEAFYRDLVEQANSIILCFDTQGILTYVNEFGLDYFGFAREEMLGRSLIGTIVPETESSGRDLARMIQDIGERPELYARNENENQLHNGERVWVAWSNRALRDEDQVVTGVLSVGNDISNRRYAEEALRARHRDLAAAHRVTEVMLEAGSAARGLEPAAAIISAATGFAMVVVAVQEPGQDALTCRAAHGIPGDAMLRVHTLPVWESAAGRVLRTGRTFATANWRNGDHDPDPWVESLDPARVLIVPMPGADTVTGALMLLDPRPAPVDEDDRGRAEGLARHVARFLSYGP